MTLAEEVAHLIAAGASVDREAARAAFASLREALSAGTARAAEPDATSPAGWRVNTWVKQESFSEIIKRADDRPLIIPEGAVVVPGARAVTAGKGPEWGLSLSTPVIVKYHDSRTDTRTELEAWIR